MGRENCPLVTLARTQKQWDLRDSFMTATTHPRSAEMSHPSCPDPPVSASFATKLTYEIRNSLFSGAFRAFCHGTVMFPS